MSFPPSVPTKLAVHRVLPDSAGLNLKGSVFCQWRRFMPLNLCFEFGILRYLLEGIQFSWGKFASYW